MQAAICADPAVFALWRGLTPLESNEFICWVEDAKQAATRARRIGRTVELREGRSAPAAGRALHPPHRQGAKPVATGGADRRQGEGALGGQPT